ncbi:hypothetical protein B0H66DRAFT_538978 [Apodospora peruviana]|uniref:DUF2828 domain-containing protein n=1 Tax=Apodospora peruviana TaxID=516989 RepID=A0AAE0HSH6_9PEZI|nr:hypothetical protein B0H66DRAFT_538978 [Apodospora peruviana]
MDALLTSNHVPTASLPAEEVDMEHKMLTENRDITFRSTKNPLGDLSTELEDVVSGTRLRELLNAAWTDDPLTTLKIIFNARSIHLGKSSHLAVGFRELDKASKERYKPSMAKAPRQTARDNRHSQAISNYGNKPVHQALHLSLTADLALLRSEDTKTKRNVPLCAKRAPSTARFHDKHTFIVSSIAEIMYPESLLAIPDRGTIKDRREIYLRYARETYRNDVSALRKYLEILEQNITAKTFNKIKHERCRPSP